MTEFWASLQPDGTILEDGTGEAFPRPSSWSIVAKRRLNPGKLADDGNCPSECFNAESWRRGEMCRSVSLF